MKTTTIKQSEKTYTESEVKARVFDALTVMLLRLRNEIFDNGGMDRRDFDASHFPDGFTSYERNVAKREGIEIK